MTADEFTAKLTVKDVSKYSAQLTNVLNANMSDIFTILIKDAARCNRYSSDIFYDLTAVRDRMEHFSRSEPFEKMLFGFRKDGVDCTNFVLSRCSNPLDAYDEYFAFYSLGVEHEEDDFYKLVLTEYYV